MSVISFFRSILATWRKRRLHKQLVADFASKLVLQEEGRWRMITAQSSDVEEAKEILGTYRKKGRIKVNHDLIIDRFDVLNDLAYGMIQYSDTGEMSSDCVISLRLLNVFFNKI